MSNEKVVVFAVDGKKRSMTWLKVALESARRFLPPETELVVFTDAAWTEDDVGFGAKVLNICETVAACGLGRLGALSTFHGEPIPAMQFLRLAFPVMPELARYEKIVYCDIDVEFVDERAAEIFDVGVDGYDVAMVAEDTDYALSCLERMSCAFDDPLACKDGIERTKRRVYCNSGVMVMNLKAMRGWITAETVREFVEMKLRYRFGCVDQEILNLCFRVKTMPAEFNWMVHLPMKTKIKRGYIRHYAGMVKMERKRYPPSDYAPFGQEVVDVVYLLGDGSAHDDIEIRWSLRSLARFGKNVGRVIVACNRRREWLAEAVAQVVIPDNPRRYKHANMLAKIMGAVENCGIRGDVVVMSDDHILLKETDFAKLPVCIKGWTVGTERRRRLQGRETAIWAGAIRDSRQFLYDYGLPMLDFQMHRPHRYNADVMRDNREMVDFAMLREKGVEPSLLLGNLWMKENPRLPLTLTEDCKIGRLPVGGFAEGEACFSFGDESFRDAEFLAFMKREYGAKCRYER